MTNTLGSFVNKDGTKVGEPSLSRLALFMLEPEKQIAWHTGYLLHSITIKQQENGWLMVIRVNSTKGGRLVSFIQTSCVDGCWNLLYTALHSNSFNLTWHQDKFT